MPPNDPRIDDLQSQIDDLKAQLQDAQTPRQLNLLDIFIDVHRKVDEARGIFQVVSAAPSAAPIDAYDQIQVYVNGTTYRLYWYDWNASVWHYVTATA